MSLKFFTNNRRAREVQAEIDKLELERNSLMGIIREYQRPPKHVHRKLAHITARLHEIAAREMAA